MAQIAICKKSKAKEGGIIYSHGRKINFPTCLFNKVLFFNIII